MDHIKTSEQIAELAKALALAQGEFDDAILNSRNPHFDSEYADMSAVRKAVRGPLAKNGLSISQHPVTVDGKLNMTTILLHASGQWIQSTFVLNVEKPTMQGLKSATTYGRRMAVLSILGVAEGDDDGEEAEKHPAKATPKKPAAAPAVKPKDQAPAPEVKPVGQDKPAPALASKAQSDQIKRDLVTVLGMSQEDAQAWLKTNSPKPKSSEWTVDDIKVLRDKIDAEIEMMEREPLK